MTTSSESTTKNIVHDVVLANIAVHGGSYHKLIRFARYLNDDGTNCQLLLNSSPPLGLQKGVDIDEQQASSLQAEGVLILTLLFRLHSFGGTP